MIVRPETFNNNSEDFFSLHDGIKEACGFYPADLFNADTLNALSQSAQSAKKIFYWSLAGLSVFGLTSILLGSYFIEQVQSVPHLPNLELKEGHRLVRRNFAGTLTAFGLISAGVSGLIAHKSAKRSGGDEKSMLLERAHHPGIAHQVFTAVNNIITNRIPVYINHNGRMRLISIHTAAGPRKNAMLLLLGDDKHRQALWQEGSIAGGRILIKKKYHDQILGNLFHSIRHLDKETKDNRDHRYLVTALLSKDHMILCFKVMNSEFYWKGRRKTNKRGVLMGISEILLENWSLWESFRKNVTGNLTNARSKTHKFHKFAESLLETNNRNKVELIDVLMGKDRTGCEFFRTLEALSEQDLVERGTSVK